LNVLSYKTDNNNGTVAVDSYCTIDRFSDLLPKSRVHSKSGLWICILSSYSQQLNAVSHMWVVAKSSRTLDAFCQSN